MSATSDTRLLSIFMACAVLFWAMRRAAGRLAPRVAIAPMIFLVTRTPVLVAWAFGAMGMFALLLPGAIEHGHDTPSDLAIMTGLSLFSGLGVAALVVGPVFFIVRAFAPSPVFPLEEGEEILREITANHFIGGEARGGKLILTTRRVGFRPHRFNVQLATWSVPIGDVLGTSVEGERFLLLETKGAKDPEWIVVMRPEEVGREVRALGESSEAQ